MKKTHRATRLATLLAASLAINGCAVPPRASSGGSTSGQTGSAPPDVRQVCNPLIVGLGAAALCAAVASGKNRVRTGAACAALAVTACYLANSYRSEQTRSAQEVEDDYRRQNRPLPDRATVTSYRSELNPRSAVTRGQEVRLTSTIVAVAGRNDRSIVVEEEIGLVDATGETWGRPVRKVANGNHQTGEFRTSFTIPVSDGMSQGVYTLKRALYVNGAAVQRDDASTRFQVVRVDGSDVAQGIALMALPAAR